MKRLLLVLCLVACGEQAKDVSLRSDGKDVPTNDRQVEDLKQQVLELQGTVSQLNNMVLSDFSSCSIAGDTADPLINKICKVAQASTVEAKVLMKSELQTFTDALEEKLSYVNKDLAKVLNELDGVSISSIQTSITTINSTLTSLDSRMTSAESAISALQVLTASITGTLNGTVKEIQVGSENLAAGPVYESLLKRVDGTTISGYVEVASASVAMGTDPIATTTSSATLTYTTSSAHGFVAGNLVLISGLDSGKGWAASEVNGEYIIVSAPTTTTFTITMPRVSTKTGSFGGSTGSAKKISGRGLGQIWATGDGDDASVRVANPRGKPYNFIIVEDGTGKGFVCYDKTNVSANFATLNAGACQTDGIPAGNCACK